MMKLKIETNLPRIISLSNITKYLVEGWVCGPSITKKISLSLNDRVYTAEDICILRPDLAGKYNDGKLLSMFSGFSVSVPIYPVQENTQYDVNLTVALADGYEETFTLGTLLVKPWNNFVLNEAAGDRDCELAICMATYNPEKESFIRQIESIKQQDYNKWICIICDDNSSVASKAVIRKAIDNDDRFILYEFDENVGFYRNFERCLFRIPKAARYVALSDQDDFWYPNKLSTCLNEFQGGVSLVFSDMRIVTSAGAVVSDTYWVNRKNHYDTEDVDLLALANTVTGAACIFRADLLNTILPFPPRYGDLYHDHWIAVIAAISGTIKYVDRPLYDYMQYSSNVIGHYDFSSASIFRFITSNYYVKQLCQQLPGRDITYKLYLTYQNVGALILEYYKFRSVGGKHIQTIVDNAILRTQDKAISSKLEKILTISGLIGTRIKISRKGFTANNNELTFLLSLMTDKLYKATRSLLHLALRVIVSRRSRLGLSHQLTDPYLVEFKRKFSGRTFAVKEVRSRVNVLLPSLDSANFFGGYIGMLNFAKCIHESGCKTRILLTDQNEVFTSELIKIQKHDVTLNDFLAEVEIEACYSQDDIIEISSNDIFVATSWWTAHIAHEAVAKTSHNKFIFLEQDYEPIFYEHGAYRVLAEQCYGFSHVPMYSTALLQDFFVRKGIITPCDKGEYFNNPVLDFQLTDSFSHNKARKRRLLFYARPQPHNARNLYPLGCLAIDKAGAMGYFAEEEWEIIGIGGDVGEQKLPCGLTIRHIGKFDLQKYKELLPEHDLGLSLMDSPHPSLLPIEMASAGLLVVTNTYDIKDAHYFTGISSNIKAVPSDMDSLALALIEQSSRVGDLDQRLKGSKVNWPHSWEEALPLKKIENVLNAVMASQ